MKLRSIAVLVTGLMAFVSAVPATAQAENIDPSVIRQRMISSLDSWLAGASGPATTGDLDSDGNDDVLVTAAQQQPYNGEDTYAVTARRGTDGDVLWSQNRVGVAVGARPARLGAGNGVLLTIVEPMVTAPSTGGHTSSLAVRYEALGADGNTVWQRRFVGSAVKTVAGYTISDVPLNPTLLPGNDGPDDLAVHLWDATRLENGVASDTYRAVVLNGRDGSTKTAAVHVEPTRDTRSELHAVPDITGDGRDDIGFLIAAGEGSASLSAHGGQDGLLRWAARPALPPGNTSVIDVGDVSGDGVSDPVIAIAWAEDLHDVALVDGRTGTLRWRRYAVHPYRLGDVNGDGVDEVGLVEVQTHSHELTAHFDAVDGVGTTTRRVSHVLEAPAGSYAFWGSFLPLDADDDKTRDITFSLRSDVPGHFTEFSSEHGVFNGARGQVMWRAPGHLGAMGSAELDASGDDLILEDSSSAESFAVEGATGATLWRQPAGDSWNRVPPMAEAINANGDTHQDFLFGAAESQTLVRDGRDGSVLWQTW